jgi:hypothetical protein
MSKKPLTLDMYKTLFGEHDIRSYASFLAKWEVEGFREVFCSPTFIPAINQGMIDVVQGLNTAAFAELLQIEPSQRRKAVKALNKKAFGPMGAKRCCAPLEALDAINLAAYLPVEGKVGDGMYGTHAADSERYNVAVGPSMYGGQ